MALNYNFPRVDVTTTALQRKNLSPVTEDTLVLFAPFKGSYGPINEVVICHSYADFTDSFGELDYDINGQNGIQIKNWLDNGGTVYAVRVEVTEENKPLGTHVIPAEYANKIVDDIDPIFPLDQGENHLYLVENSVKKDMVESLSLNRFGDSTIITDSNSSSSFSNTKPVFKKISSGNSSLSDPDDVNYPITAYRPITPTSFICYCPEIHLVDSSK